MPQTKAMRRATVPVTDRPHQIDLALRCLRSARDVLRACGAEKAAIKANLTLKSAEGAHRHADRMASEYAASIRVAYCNAKGLIEFGLKVPNGHLPIARGPEAMLRDLIEGEARHGYSTRKVRGRPTKIPGTECLLVPGIPEAPDQSAGLRALHLFIDRMQLYKEGRGHIVFGAKAG